jgi:hypothetical protein
VKEGRQVEGTDLSSGAQRAEEQRRNEQDEVPEWWGRELSESVHLYKSLFMGKCKR